jgi:hypothetical protein
VKFLVHGKEPTAWMWITRDGREIQVNQMTDDHLLCTIRFLCRWAQRASDRFNDSFNSCVWDKEDEDACFWMYPELVLKSVKTWPALIFTMQYRNLKEYPVEDDRLKPTALEENDIFSH